MSSLDYYMVDVFSKKKFSGNQLAVVITSKNLDSSQMQAIAREFNFSETAFIILENSISSEHNVRIFTPQTEVPFAGHPTLGTAYIINNILLKEPRGQISLNLSIGRIAVTFEEKKNETILWMKQVNPSFGTIHEHRDIAPIISLSVKELDTGFPIQEISTGLPFLIIPIKNLAAVKKAKINLSQFDSYFHKENARPIFIFSPQTYEKENNINARMFADIFGISEDPATGSANGCLAAYIIRHQYMDKSKIELKVEQGYEIGRKSILYLKAEALSNNSMDINVGGNVHLIARGSLYID